MLEEIESVISGNCSPRFLHPFGVRHDARTDTLEKDMYDFLKAAGEKILAGGRWRDTPKTLNAESELLHLFNEVVIGRATLEDFKAACCRWEALGSIGNECRRTVSATTTGAGNPLMEDAKKRAAVHKPEN